MTARIASINVAAIRKFLKTVKATTAEEKSRIQILKKQLSTYERYVKSGAEPDGLVEIKKMIFASIAKIKKLSGNQ